MSGDKSVQEKMELLSEKMAWFHGEEFNLDEAAGRYKEIEQLAKEIEAVLSDMKNDIEVLTQKFN